MGSYSKKDSGEYMRTLSKSITAFLVLNSIFWGLMSHSTHCDVAALAGIKNCPPHWVHLMIGLVSFVAAIGVSQWKYLTVGIYKY